MKDKIKSIIAEVKKNTKILAADPGKTGFDELLEFLVIFAKALSDWDLSPAEIDELVPEGADVYFAFLDFSWLPNFIERPAIEFVLRLLLEFIAKKI